MNSQDEKMRHVTHVQPKKKTRNPSLFFFAILVPTKKKYPQKRVYFLALAILVSLS
jgi:hypothetical protein